MLTFLKKIAEVILNIPEYILYVIESAFNLVMEAVSALFALATVLIPLPSEPAPPQFIAEINWFYPIGALISIATPIVVGYASFLAIRWIYAKVGNL